MPDLDQINIIVTDIIPPDNFATVDAGVKVGNTYTKEQDNEWRKEVQNTVKSGIVGVLKPNTPYDAVNYPYPKPWAQGDADLYEKYDVHESGNFPSAKNVNGDPLEVFPQELENAEVQIWIKNAVAEKVVKSLPQALNYILSFDDLHFPVTNAAAEKVQTIYDGVYYQLKDGETSTIADLPLTSDKWQVIAPKKYDSYVEFSGTESYIQLIANDIIAGGDVAETYVFDVFLPLAPFSNSVLATGVDGSLMIQLSGNNLLLTKSGVATMFSFDISAYSNSRRTLVVARTLTTYDLYINGNQISKTSVNGYSSMIASQYMNIGGYDGVILSIPIKLFNFFKINRALSAGEIESLENSIDSYSDESVFNLKNNAIGFDFWQDVNGFAETTEFKNVTGVNPNFIYNKEAKISLLARLPDTINAATGKELNIYWGNILSDYKNYKVELIIPGTDSPLNKVRNMNDCMRITYTTAGTYSGILNLYDFSGKLIESKTLNIVVSASNAGTGTIQIMDVGDSTMDDALMLSPGVPYYDHEGPQITKTIHDEMVSSGGPVPLMIGHKRNYPPYYHAGMAGWRSADFLNSNSPFWDGTANNFTQYVTEQIATIPGAVNRIDVMIYQIGINDLKVTAGYPQAVIDNIKTFVNQFLAEYPSAKVIVGIPASGCDMTGYSEHFYNLGSFIDFTAKMRELQKLMIENFDNGTFLPNVYLANAGQCIDRVYGFPYKQVPISSRVTETILQHWDSVHPNEFGYNQMADCYFARIKSII